MLLSLRKSGLTSSFKEVTGFSRTQKMGLKLLSLRFGGRKCSESSCWTPGSAEETSERKVSAPKQICTFTGTVR